MGAGGKSLVYTGGVWGVEMRLGGLEPRSLRRRPIPTSWSRCSSLARRRALLGLPSPRRVLAALKRLRVPGGLLLTLGEWHPDTAVDRANRAGLGGLGIDDGIAAFGGRLYDLFPV